jgi:hypothetical protein
VDREEKSLDRVGAEYTHDSVVAQAEYLIGAHPSAAWLRRIRDRSSNSDVDFPRPSSIGLEREPTFRDDVTQFESAHAVDQSVRPALKKPTAPPNHNGRRAVAVYRAPWRASNDKMEPRRPQDRGKRDAPQNRATVFSYAASGR